MILGYLLTVATLAGLLGACWFLGSVADAVRRTDAEGEVFCSDRGRRPLG